MIEAPRKLHRQCGTALTLPAVVGCKTRSYQSDRVDAGVPAEPSILLEEERVNQFRRDFGEWRPKAVLVI
jgi:hypothetical protein